MLRSVLWPVEHAYAVHRLRFGINAFDRLYPKPAREYIMASRTSAAG